MLDSRKKLLSGCGWWKMKTFEVERLDMRQLSVHVTMTVFSKSVGTHALKMLFQ